MKTTRTMARKPGTSNPLARWIWGTATSLVLVLAGGAYGEGCDQRTCEDRCRELPPWVVGDYSVLGDAGTDVDIPDRCATDAIAAADDCESCTNALEDSLGFIVPEVACECAPDFESGERTLPIRSPDECRLSNTPYDQSGCFIWAEGRANCDDPYYPTE